MKIAPKIKSEISLIHDRLGSHSPRQSLNRNSYNVIQKSLNKVTVILVQAFRLSSLLQLHLLHFPLVERLCYFKTHVHKKLHNVVGRVEQKHRDPMKFVHLIGGINTVRRAERAEHLGRQLQIDNVDNLVVVKPELATGDTHNDSIPFTVIRVPQHRRLKKIVKRIVRRCAVCIEAVFKKILLCHRWFSFLLLAVILQ